MSVFANVGNHIHLLIQARSRKNLRAFLREAAGLRDRDLLARLEREGQIIIRTEPDLQFS